MRASCRACVVDDVSRARLYFLFGIHRFREYVFDGFDVFVADQISYTDSVCSLTHRGCLISFAAKPLLHVLHMHELIVQKFI